MARASLTRNPFNGDAYMGKQPSPEQLEAVDALASRFIGGKLAPEDVTGFGDAFVAWINRENLWDEIPLLPEDEELRARTPLPSPYQEQRGDLTELIVRANAEAAVFNFILHKLSDELEGRLRCGVLADARVDGYHRPMQVAASE